MISKKRYVLVFAHEGREDDFVGTQVLLVLKNRPSWQSGFLNLVGGKIEDGETPEDAAVRELEEETGYKPSSVSSSSTDIKQLGKIEGKEEEILCFKIDVDRSKPPKPREGETEVARWFPWRWVKSDKRLMPNLRIIIPFMIFDMDDWSLEAESMNKKYSTLNLTMPSNLHKSFKKRKSITNIIKNGTFNRFDIVLDR